MKRLEKPWSVGAGLATMYLHPPSLALLCHTCADLSLGLPCHTQDFDQITALRVMWQYLTDSAVAPLQKALVDTADPFCSDVDASFCENSVFVQVHVLPSLLGDAHTDL